MKIVLFFPSLYPNVTGGMEVYNYHLANHLLSDDRDNVILVTHDKNCADGQKRLFASQRLFLTRKYGLDILSMLVYCIFSSKIRVRDWSHIMIPYTSSFDLCAWPFFLFQKVFGFNYSVHCHGGGAKPWKHPKLQQRFFDKALHKAAVSETLRTEYSKRLGYKIEYLPPLVEFSIPKDNKQTLRKKYGLESFDKIILFVGSIKPLKAPEVLLKAFMAINKDIKNNKRVALVFAGDGPLRKELENKYRSDDIFFLGKIPNESVYELFAISDIYTIPSWFEGTSVSLLEAMSKNLCCIGTDVQGINTMIQNERNGLLFPKDDDKALTILIERVLTEEDITEHLGKNAHSFFLNNYSYDNHVNEVLKFLNYYN